MKHTKHTPTIFTWAAVVFALACCVPNYFNAAFAASADDGAGRTQFNTFYEQLCAFNYNWQKYQSVAPAGKARIFNTDGEYVQAHLSSVIPILLSNPVQHLSAEQRRSRMHLIDLLDGYCAAGHFPLNHYSEVRVPVFIDEHKTYCAVGYLLQQTGHDAVARRIAQKDNYVWVRDIEDADVLAWQRASGLSLEELKLIQGVYDFYMPNARLVANKYEIPQKPECETVYFEQKDGQTTSAKKNIWLRGEGTNGVLNGRWEQNFSPGVPWIAGYYQNGKRTGQWKEYYKGTDKLCRTENWRNDKLNGVRKRFNKQGELIEEILFKDGVAVKKTNYELADSLTYIRKPLEDNLVYTEVYTFGGTLLAAGNEGIYNPGNLQWFQNIELTALNTAFESQRTAVRVMTDNGWQKEVDGKVSFQDTPQLVQYKKEGTWMYYKESFEYGATTKTPGNVKNALAADYRHFGEALYQSMHRFDELNIQSGYDSVRVEYAKDALQDFYGYIGDDPVHLQVRYNTMYPNLNPVSWNGPNGISGINVWDVLNHVPNGRHGSAWGTISAIGQLDAENRKIGVWKHYNTGGEMYKTEHFFLPYKEEEADMSRK